MDVRCDKCNSEYELDDNRVTAQGVSVKCTSCGHVFRVARAAPSTKQPTTGDWMIRQASGHVFKFKELTTLQRWIVERRVTRDDEISKTGDTWKRLGDILELASFFQVAEQAAIVPQQQSPDSPTQGSDSSDEDSPRRSSLGLIAGVAVVAVALIVCIVLFRQQIVAMFKQVPVTAQQTAPPQNNVVEKHIANGYRELHRDTLVSFMAAEQEFEKALTLQQTNTAALAGATLALCDWAEIAREESQQIDVGLKAAAAGKVRISATELAAMATELGKKQSDAAVKTERAFAYMKRTMELDKSEKDGLLAATRYYALTNAQEAFRGISDKANATLIENPEYNYSVGKLRRLDDTALEAAKSAFQQALDREPEHVGARYRLAEIAIKQGDKVKALQALEEVLKRSPDHVRAVALKKSLETPPKVDSPAKEDAKPAAPENFDQLLSRANRARHAERVKLAMEFYGRALELKPDNAEALTGLGLCYIDSEQPGNAIAQFQKALAANSRYSDAHMGMAEAFRSRGQKRDAVKHYQRYLDLAPDGNEASVAREALKQLGQE